MSSPSQERESSHAVSSISLSAVWVPFTPQVGFLYAAGLSFASAALMFLLTK